MEKLYKLMKDEFDWYCTPEQLDMLSNACNSDLQDRIKELEADYDEAHKDNQQIILDLTAKLQQAEAELAEKNKQFAEQIEAVHKEWEARLQQAEDILYSTYMYFENCSYYPDEIDHILEKEEETPKLFKKLQDYFKLTTK